MEAIPTLEHTEDIELVVHTRQTSPNSTPVEVSNNSGDEEEESTFHDALTDFNASTDEQLAATVQSHPGPAAEDSASKTLKKLWTSVSKKANSIIGIGVFILTIIGVVYTLWTAKKDYYEYCYERSKMPGGLSPECDSALRDGISPPFHWHTVKSVPGIAAKTLHQGQNMTLSTLDFYLSHTRPAVVFLSGALCSLLLAGICFCTAKYERPARKVLVRTVRQPEAWVATVLARQAHHLKGRQQQWRMRQTKQVQNLHFDKNEWTTAVKSGVASTDLHRPCRGFTRTGSDVHTEAGQALLITRTESDVDSEASQTLLSEGLSTQAQMRCNAEILATYISHLRECYSPSRPAMFIGNLLYTSDHENSIVSCSRVDLRQSLHNLQPRSTSSTSSTARIRRKDIFSASNKCWMLQLPSEISLSEKFLTVDHCSGPKIVFEADHFCDVHQNPLSAACHINHFFSITILGNTSCNEIVILVHSHSRLRYRTFLAELQDSTEQPLPPIWFNITPIWGGPGHDGNSPKANFSDSYLPDLELSNCLKESVPFFAFKCIGEHPIKFSAQDDLFLPLPDLQELHMHWDQGDCELSQVFSNDEIILTCSGHDKWRPNLSLEDGVTSVYNQNVTLDEPLNTTLDAICRINDWLLHKLRCSTVELNSFIKNLPEPLSTFLLEDPDFNSNLTDIWTQNISNCGFLNIDTSFNTRRYSGSEYSLWQPSASLFIELVALTQNASSTVSTSDHEPGSPKPAHIVSTIASSIKEPISILSARPRTKSAPDILDRNNCDFIYVARPLDKKSPSHSCSSSSRLSSLRRTQRPEPEEIEYAHCLAVVESPQAKLRNDEKAHDKPKHETATRAELDLRLDTTSFGALKGDGELLNQLDRAETKLELAEVRMQNRRMHLANDYLCADSPEDIYIQDEDLCPDSPEDIYIQDEDFYVMMEDSSPAHSQYINQWLDDCLRGSQKDAWRFVRQIGYSDLSSPGFNVKDAVQRHWHKDGTELEFAIAPDCAAGPPLVNLPASANGFVKVGAKSELGVFHPRREHYSYKTTPTGSPSAQGDPRTRFIGGQFHN